MERSYESLHRRVQLLYSAMADEVPFHGWSHVAFVESKAVEFAAELGADPVITRVAALTHDLNYLVGPNTAATDGDPLRTKLLGDVGASRSTANRINAIVAEAETATRGADISAEAKALSDGDTVFKALPVTPVVLAPLYLAENGVSVRVLANKILSEQEPLFSDGIYFYSTSARNRYSRWAEANLQLWRCIAESMDDADVERLVNEVRHVSP